MKDKLAREALNKLIKEISGYRTSCIRFRSDVRETEIFNNSYTSLRLVNERVDRIVKQTDEYFWAIQDRIKSLEEYLGIKYTEFKKPCHKKIK